MWIALLIIGVAVLMMVGPLMAIRPTRGQARLADMRQLALKEGLAVRMRQDPGPRQQGLVAVYTINLPNRGEGKNSRSPERRQARKANPWLLVRREYAHELHFQGEWDWQGEERPVDAVQTFLRQHLGELDNAFLAVESTGHSFGVYWTETLAGRSAEQRVNEVAKWLKELVEREPAAAQ